MAGPLLSNHRDYLIEKHRTGVTAGELASEFGVTHKVIVRILGSEYRPGRLRVDDAAVVAAYVAGNSENAVAKMFGIARRAVASRLLAAGVQRRSQSESEALKWSKMTAKQRAQQVAAANAAARGRTKSFEEKCLAARTREANPTVNVSHYELALRRAFTDAGIEFVPQKAVGPYNCDIACGSIAVEVWGGGWHFGGNHLARTPERIRYFLNSGWDMLILVCDDSFPLTTAVCDYMVRTVQKACRNPSSHREYRVVWGAGEFSTGGSADDDQISVEPPFTCRRDPRTGQYQRIPR